MSLLSSEFPARYWAILAFGVMSFTFRKSVHGRMGVIPPDFIGYYCWKVYIWSVRRFAYPLLVLMKSKITRLPDENWVS